MRVEHAKQEKAHDEAEAAAAEHARLAEAQERLAVDPLDAFAGQRPQDGIPASTDVNMGSPSHAQPNGSQAVNGEAAAALAPAFGDAAAHPSTTASSLPVAPPAQELDISKPHYVDFDLMQNKLIDTKAGYLTLRAFLRDIERMAHNVVISVDDLDKRQKAHAMVIETKLLLKDHFQDEQQKLDFEAMAFREKMRRAAAEPNKRKSPGSTSSRGTRQSARMTGQAPEFGVQALQDLEAANRKRQRETSGASEADVQGEAGPAAKKMRMNINGDLGDAPSTSTAGDPPVMADGVHGSAPDASSSSINVSMQAAPLPPTEPARPATPPPPPPPPPFVLPELAMQELADRLQESTEEFTVEDLEQLRAHLMQRIWRKRGEWDRTALLEELSQATTSVVARVQAANQASRLALETST